VRKASGQNPDSGPDLEALIQPPDSARLYRGLPLQERIEAARARLREAKSPAYAASLMGTIGLDPACLAAPAG